MTKKIPLLCSVAAAALCLGSFARAEVLRFTTTLSGANEVPAVSSMGSGRAELTLDTATNTFTAYVQVTGLGSALAASHIHEGAAGSNGPVVVGLGGASSYVAAANGFYAGKFTGAYTGDVAKLIAGGAYVNVHSANVPSGELRGQLRLAPATQEHLLNFSSRGLINPGNGRAGTLYGGFVLAGERTVTMRALGASLSAFGVANALPDAAVELFNASGARIASNDDWASTQPLALRATGLAPAVATDAAITRTLPAGTYTAQVDSSKGAGVAVLEIYSTPTPTLIGALQAAGQFNTLIAAVQAAGLVDVLSGPGPFTLFGPTDAAFAALPAGTLDTLLLPANRATLTSILLYHLLPAKVLSTDLSEGLQARTLQGGSVTISLAGGARVNAAGITEVDLVVRSGVIHPINAVLTPPGS